MGKLLYAKTNRNNKIKVEDEIFFEATDEDGVVHENAIIEIVNSEYERYLIKSGEKFSFEYPGIYKIRPLLEGFRGKITEIRVISEVIISVDPEKPTLSTPIRITTKSTNGRPISGLDIKIKGNKQLIKRKTNQYGEIVLKKGFLPPGDYTVIVGDTDHIRGSETKFLVHPLERISISIEKERIMIKDQFGNSIPGIVFLLDLIENDYTRLKVYDKSEIDTENPLIVCAGTKVLDEVKSSCIFVFKKQPFDLYEALNLMDKESLHTIVRILSEDIRYELEEFKDWGELDYSKSTFIKAAICELQERIEPLYEYDEELFRIIAKNYGDLSPKDIVERLFEKLKVLVDST